MAIAKAFGTIRLRWLYSATRKIGPRAMAQRIKVSAYLNDPNVHSVLRRQVFPVGHSDSGLGLAGPEGLESIKICQHSAYDHSPHNHHRLHLTRHLDSSRAHVVWSNLRVNPTTRGLSHP